VENLQNYFEFFLLTPGETRNQWYQKFRDLTPNLYHLEYFLRDYYFIPFFLNFLKSRQIDLLLASHCNFVFSIYPYLAYHHPQIKRTILIHNDLTVYDLERAVEQEAFTDLYIAVFPRIRETMINRYQISPEKIKVIFNGVNLEELSPQNYPPKETLRKELNLPPQGKIIIFLGRVSSEKRPQDFTALAKIFVEEKDLVFLMVGDGPLLPGIKKAMRGFPNFIARGFSDQLGEILKAGDLLILPSALDGLPMTVLEALAMGVPVLASNLGGLPEIIKEGKNGFLVPPLNLPEFAAKIKLLLDNPQLWEKLKRNARESIRQKFSLPKMSENYFKAFSSLIAKN